MKLPSIVSESLIAMIITSGVHAEPPGKDVDSAIIPLDQIWGYRIPGTRPVQDLENVDLNLPPKEYFQHSLVNQIAEVLRFDNLQDACESFVVGGVKAESLKNAHAVFTGRQKPSDCFPENTDLTLVFYAYQSPWYIRVEGVHRADHHILIEFRPVSHRALELTKHFALIPLGKLAAGEYRVDVQQLPATGADRGPVTVSLDQGPLVSQGCSFVIRRKEESR